MFTLVLQGRRAGTKNHRGGLGQPLAPHQPVPTRADPLSTLRTCPHCRYADTQDTLGCLGCPLSSGCPSLSKYPRVPLRWPAVTPHGG